MALRLATKRWMREVESLLTRIVKNGGQRGEMIVCGSINAKWSRNQGERAPLHEKFSLVTRVIFLLNVTKVGNYVCAFAANLVEVEIPEGITSIGVRAFYGCRILTTVSFPTTLISISSIAFLHCSSLENVDLLHTNVQELGNAAFDECSELKSMTIPDSLQTLGSQVFLYCSKLVPSNIDVREYDSDEERILPDTRSKVVAHLRSHPRTTLKNCI